MSEDNMRVMPLMILLLFLVIVGFTIVLYMNLNNQKILVNECNEYWKRQTETVCPNIKWSDPFGYNASKYED